MIRLLLSTCEQIPPQRKRTKKSPMNQKFMKDKDNGQKDNKNRESLTSALFLIHQQLPTIKKPIISPISHLKQFFLILRLFS